MPRKTFGSYNPISAAQNLGRQLLKEPGARFFHEFQVSHILTCLGHARFTDNPQSRIRRHVWIEAPTGIGKTTTMLAFVEEVAGASNVLETGFIDDAPTYAHLTGSGITWESMRGSASSKGGLVKPIFYGIDYLLAPELMSFVGTKQGSSHERINELCSILEEGQVSVRLIKMAEASEKAWEKFETECKALGITVNSELRGFTYPVTLSMWAATRPLKDEDNKDYISESGLRPRFSVRSYESTETEMRTFRRRQFGKMDPDQLDKLRRFNLFAYRTHVEEVREPPSEMMDELVDFYFDNYERIADGSGLSINEVASGRDFNDAAQLLVARCAADAFVKAWEDGKEIIRNIEYDPKHLKWVKAFKEPYFATLHDECMTKSKENKNILKAQSMLATYLKTAMASGAIIVDARSIHPIIPSKELIPLLRKEFRVSQARAYELLKEMKKVGLVKNSEYGTYEVVGEGVLRMADLEVDQDSGNVIPNGKLREILLKEG